MEVAILTVGDEVLAGDIVNSNANWLAAQLTEKGVTVDRILTISDDRALIRSTVEKWSSMFDAVIVTGGLGGTHDDVTADALADAFDRDLMVDEAVREDVIESVADYRGVDPETLDEETIDLDIDAWAALPAGSRVLINPEGLCPGCVIENVYAFPGVPSEVKALFESVAADFSGATVTETVYTSQPEGSMVEAVTGVREQFDISIGSYPTTDGPNRLRVSGSDPQTVTDATNWLRDRVEIVSEDWDPVADG